MGRADSPSDVQLARAFVAAAAGLAIALFLLRPVVDVPSLRTLPPELRAVAGIPCLVIKVFTGEF